MRPALSLFLLTFFVVYGSANAYALLKAKSALGFGWGTAAAVVPLLAVLTAGPLIVYLLARHGMEGAARAASWIAYLWLGLLFLFTWLNLAADALRLLGRLAEGLAGFRIAPPHLSGKAGFSALLVLTLSLAILGLSEASRLRVERVRIRTDRIAAPRLRIVQISDVHLGLMVRHGRARAIAEAVRAERPDLLVSTGDLVDAEINHLEGLAEIFAALRPPLGKYAVTGNHEFYAGIGQALDFTRRAGFAVLRQEAAVPREGLRIVGVDDPTGAAFGERRSPKEEELLDGASRGFTILLKHRPQIAGTASRLPDLQLSGHTHGGQIFPFRYFVRLFYPLLEGPHSLGNGGLLYTSRGTATWGPPMRLLAPPEITVIDVEGVDAGSPSLPPGHPEPPGPASSRGLREPAALLPGREGADPPHSGGEKGAPGGGKG